MQVASYNCWELHVGKIAGDRARRVVVHNLLKNGDILCLQEPFLATQDLEKLNSLMIISMELVNPLFYGNSERKDSRRCGCAMA